MGLLQSQIQVYRIGCSVCYCNDDNCPALGRWHDPYAVGIKMVKQFRVRVAVTVRSIATIAFDTNYFSCKNTFPPWVIYQFGASLNLSLSKRVYLWINDGFVMPLHIVLRNNSGYGFDINEPPARCRVLRKTRGRSPRSCGRCNRHSAKHHAETRRNAPC